MSARTSTASTLHTAQVATIDSEALRSDVIDDCALGRNVKRGGPVWLGLSGDTRSIRPYQGIGDVWNMVARSAYTQLAYSPWLLAGTLVGLALLYLVPPLCVLTWPLHGSALAAGLAAAAWALQALSLTSMTFDSARRHYRREGALWKGAQEPDAKRMTRLRRR